MKNIFALAAALACAQLCLAQEVVRKVIELKYADEHQVEHLVQLFDAHAVSVGNGIAIRGTKEVVDAVEAAIRKIDVPTPNVDLTVYMVSASGQSEGGSPLPQDLEPVVKQLRNVFTYKNYRLLDTFVLRARPGEPGSTSGVMPSSSAMYSFEFRDLSITGEKERLVRLHELAFSVRGDFHGAQPSIRTDVDLKEGQKVVVGKATLPDSALILVLTAKVVD